MLHRETLEVSRVLIRQRKQLTCSHRVWSQGVRENVGGLGLIDLKLRPVTVAGITSSVALLQNV
jgi:hypothetical protein